MPLKEVEPLTRYIRGGVTALACKKPYPVFMDETAQLFDVISISEGLRGFQILIASDDYIQALHAKVPPDRQRQGVDPMPEILRITPRDKWEQAVAEGEFRSDDLATEGFIHCSTPEQLPWVAEKFYQGQAGLVVLRIDTEKLKSALKWEIPQDSSKPFPHVYGPINLEAVIQVIPLEEVLAGETGA